MTPCIMNAREGSQTRKVDSNHRYLYSKSCMVSPDFPSLNWTDIADIEYFRQTLYETSESRVLTEKKKNLMDMKVSDVCGVRNKVE